jgi:hypothetical protein
MSIIWHLVLFARGIWYEKNIFLYKFIFSQINPFLRLLLFSAAGASDNTTETDCSSANPSTVLSEAYYSAIILGFLRLLASLLLSKLLLHHARSGPIKVTHVLSISRLTDVNIQKYYYSCNEYNP